MEKKRLQVDVDHRTYEAIQFLRGKYGCPGGVIVDVAVEDYVKNFSTACYNLIFKGAEPQ